MKRRAQSNEKSGLPRAGVLSLLFHIALIIILGLSAKLVITKVVPSVYRVAIMPFSPQGDGVPKGGPGLTPPAQELPAPPAAEKPKAEGTPKAEKKKEKPSKADISLVPKKQKTPDTIEKGEAPPTEEESDKLHREAVEEIHRKVAIEEIQKRVDERGGAGQGATGSGSGAGSGTGTGSGGGTPKGVYAGMVDAKIKREWALPQNFSKGKSQLEAIIIVVIERDGKVRTTSFEKKSGDAVYDQMAMRAIKKAEPLPPVPQAITEDTFVIGIRFHPSEATHNP